MNHIEGSGKIRKQNVRIKKNPNFKTSDWHLIKKRLNSLIAKYKNFNKRKKDIKNIIDFAAFFHNEFQRIHPFIDGNSRTSRLLMLHILRINDIPILELPLGYFDLYLDLTKRSLKRDDQSFKYLIEEMVFMGLRKANEVLKL
jgi:prophage maintenance system killer protein